MADSTGPILAAGTITWMNRTFFERNASFEFRESVRIAVGTGIAAGFLYLVEKGVPDLGVGLAWMALLTVLLVPIAGSSNSPATNALSWLGFR